MSSPGTSTPNEDADSRRTRRSWRRREASLLLAALLAVFRDLAQVELAS